MKLLSFLPIGTLGTWTKCSKPCDTGEQSLLEDLTVKRGCNFESCRTYDELNLLTDGRMSDPSGLGFLVNFKVFRGVQTREFKDHIQSKY